MEKDQEIIRTSLRLPKRLYDKIATTAEKRGLTMHAEIINMLNDAVEAPSTAVPDSLNEWSPDIKIELDTNGMPIGIQEALLHLHAITTELDLDMVSIEIDTRRHSDERSQNQKNKDLLRILGTYHAKRSNLDDIDPA